jgi:hypothetical protein
MRGGDYRFGAFFGLDMCGKIIRVPTLDVIPLENHGILNQFPE